MRDPQSFHVAESYRTAEAPACSSGRQRHAYGREDSCSGDAILVPIESPTRLSEIIL